MARHAAAVLLLMAIVEVYAQAASSVANSSEVATASNVTHAAAVAPAAAPTPAPAASEVAVATSSAAAALPADAVAAVPVAKAPTGGHSVPAVQAPLTSRSGVAKAASNESAVGGGAAFAQPLLVARPQEQERFGISKMVKGVALLSNVLLQISPMRAVREIRQAGSTLAYDPLPIFLLWLGCLNWFLYASVGVLTGDASKVDLLQAYVIGVVCGAFYVQSIWRNCHDPEKFQSLVGSVRAGAMLLALEVLCAVFLSPKASIRILGAICASFSIIVTAAPLVSIEDIFRTQSVDSMQTDMVIVCFCGCCAWAALGFMMHDVCIALPNCFGIAIGSLQVHLILKFSEMDLWGVKHLSNSGTLKDLEDERTHFCPEKTQSRNNAAYETSLYKQAKIFVLVCMAHAHFVAASYMHFSTETLSEFCGWLAEATPAACQSKKSPSRGYAMWCKQREFQHEDVVLL